MALPLETKEILICFVTHLTFCAAEEMIAVTTAVADAHAIFVSAVASAVVKGAKYAAVRKETATTGTTIVVVSKKPPKIAKPKSTARCFFLASI